MITYNQIMDEKLVRIKTANKIRILPFYKRIGFQYPVYVKESVAKKLLVAANKLPDGYYLQIDSGYRTIKSQKQIWLERYMQFEKQNPTFTNNEIIKMTNDLVFNPKYGTPPHTTGGAVDVSLLDRNKKEINLSEPFANFYDEPQLKSNKISKKSQQLRLALNKIMLENGFAPHPNEYWHFSYGDKIWAEYYNKKVKYKQTNNLPRALKPTIFEVHLRRFVRFLYHKKRYLSKLYRGLGRP